MKNISIPKGENIQAFPIRDKSGHILCTAFFDPYDATFIDRYLMAKQSMKDVCSRLANVSIKRDGCPASIKFLSSVGAAEREVKEVVGELLHIDNPDGLFESRRPFASVQNTFYCVHVLNALSQVPKRARERVEHRAAKDIDP